MTVIILIVLAAVLWSAFLALLIQSARSARRPLKPVPPGRGIRKHNRVPEQDE